jgi:hypothetical protein
MHNNTKCGKYHVIPDSNTCDCNYSINCKHKKCVFRSPSHICYSDSGYDSDFGGKFCPSYYRSVKCVIDLNDTEIVYLKREILKNLTDAFDEYNNWVIYITYYYIVIISSDNTLYIDWYREDDICKKNKYYKICDKIYKFYVNREYLNFSVYLTENKEIFIIEGYDTHRIVYYDLAKYLKKKYNIDISKCNIDEIEKDITVCFGEKKLSNISCIVKYKNFIVYKC